MATRNIGGLAPLGVRKDPRLYDLRLRQTPLIAQRSQLWADDHDHDRDLIGGKSALAVEDRKSTRLNSSHLGISYAVFCLKKKTTRRAQSRLSAQSGAR